MEGSVASSVRGSVNKKPSRSFLDPSDFNGSAHAIECALSRMTAGGEILRVRKGLYWKGPTTRLGIAPPRPLAVALHVAGPGSGPAGYTAAAVLGLTTQVPATVEVAVPGRAPTPPAGVRFTLRGPFRRDLRLTPNEVALLEVLRDWPTTVEVDWEALASRTRELVRTGAIRPARVAEAAAAEHRPALRDGWDRLRLEIAT